MRLNLPRINTERLVMRRLEQRDSLELFAIRCDKELNRHIDISPDQTVEQTSQFIDFINAGIEDSKWLLWGVEEIASGRLVGTVSLWNFRNDHLICDLGYVTSPYFHGQGMTVEAITAALDYGFDFLSLEEIHAFTEKQNLASNNLLRKIGFKLVETKVEPGYHKERVFEMCEYKKDHPMSDDPLIH